MKQFLKQLFCFHNFELISSKFDKMEMSKDDPVTGMGGVQFEKHIECSRCTKCKKEIWESVLKLGF